MSGPQYMPLYVGDYLRDTQHLTTEQHGAYLLLLFACWTMAKIPNSDEILMTITRCESMAKWLKLRKSLEPFFKISQGFWHQKRIAKELRESRKFHKERSTSGQKGAATRWQHKVKTENGSANSSANGKTMAQLSPLPPFPPAPPFSPSPPHPEPNLSPPYSPPPRKRRGGRGEGVAKKSPRTVQIEGFAYALADRARNRDC